MKIVIMRILASILIVVFLLTSCGPLPPPGTALTQEERQEAQKSCIAKYTAMGAVGGALVGALIGGKKWEGALIGAATGGTLAFALAYGKCLETFSNLNSYPVAGAQDTARRVGYNPAQGYVTKIESFSVDPTGVAPGGKVHLDGSYYIMAPEGTMEAKVTETRTVSYYDPSEKQWKELGSVPQEVTSALGTRRAEGSFDMPKDVPEGNYRITLTVDANGKRDQISREITVKKGLAMGPESRPDNIRTAYASEQPGGKAVATPKIATITVTSKTLSLRNSPSNKSQILATLNHGEVYEVIQKTGSSNDLWYRIRLDNGVEGWVSGKNVRLQE